MGIWSFHLDQHPYAGGRRLFLVRHDPDIRGLRSGSRGVVTALSLTVYDPGSAIPDETPISETLEERQDNMGDVTTFLQAALDCAWEAGMRPKGWEDNRAELNGELKATKDHLADMRKMAKVPGA